MKFIKTVLPAILLLCVLSSFSLLKKTQPVYAFGISASFTDSIVYYTEIQVLDSVSLTSEGFLPKREAYSYQLKNYLENKGEANRTCMIYFSDSQKKIASEFDKISGKYKKNKTVSFKKIEKNDFQFKKPEE
ncbi:hypothetical protein SAMN05444405_11344 [Bacteroides luti]|uniref:Uncharacterized protein n=1 Tax=Bacteroides luti TaxID=1297750 RepID=A0A1M5E8B3_9BACE|nr:hypothetical protein [Bacteroides luti]SHF75301.1 hypothetical protein SAMN05444405_11344 [Bacteroides luti]